MQRSHFVATCDDWGLRLAPGYVVRASESRMAVGGGYWVVLAPLESGQHTVHFSGLYTYDGFSQDVRYELSVE